MELLVNLTKPKAESQNKKIGGSIGTFGFPRTMEIILMNKVIALCGKGGVGKTSISATIVKILTDRYPDKKILAIDADPAVGLATALGVTENGTINDIREDFIKLADQRKDEEALEMLHEAKDQIFEKLVQMDSFSFLAIGRPESAGCYCSVNDYLRDLIQMVSDHFDYVVIDGEAGIEQINRRVLEKVNHLLLVTDASKKGLGVINTIYNVAKGLDMVDNAGVIFNRVTNLAVTESINLGDLQMLSAISQDGILEGFDIEGKSILALPQDSVLYQGVEKALVKMGILQ